MLLYIILFVVALNLLYDLTYVEGMEAGLGVQCSLNPNVLFPKYNPTLNVYTNDNDTLYNNYQNILLAAKSSC